MNKLGVKEIEQILPHRHPFLLVDYIEDYEPGKFAVGYKCVTFREDFFKGHFPQEPVMPGVLMVEALAQTGDVYKRQEFLHLVQTALIWRLYCRIWDSSCISCFLKRLESVNSVQRSDPMWESMWRLFVRQLNLEYSHYCLRMQQDRLFIVHIL